MRHIAILIIFTITIPCFGQDTLPFTWNPDKTFVRISADEGNMKINEHFAKILEKHTNRLVTPDTRGMGVVRYHANTLQMGHKDPPVYYYRLVEPNHS